MKNQDYAALAATGLPIRFACGSNNWLRVYVGAIFEEFRDNRRPKEWAVAMAPEARQGTHLGRALADLAARIPEAHEAHAKTLAKQEASEFAAMIPVRSKGHVARI